MNKKSTCNFQFPRKWGETCWASTAISDIVFSKQQGDLRQPVYALSPRRLLGGKADLFPKASWVHYISKQDETEYGTC
jgi:hypothetical protein